MTEPTPATEDEREAQSAYQAALRIIEDMGPFYGFPTKQREFAEKFAYAAIAAGFRLHPTPSVDDVADAIAPWLSSTPQDPDDWQKQRATRIATAVIALFGGEG